MDGDSIESSDDSTLTFNLQDAEELSTCSVEDFNKYPDLRFSHDALHGPIHCVSISEVVDEQGSRYLAIGCEADVAMVWKLGAKDLLGYIEHEDTVISALFDRIGKYLLTADLSGRVNVFSVGDFSVPVLTLNEDSIEACYWHPFFNDVIVMVSRDSKITLYSASSGFYKWIFPPQANRACASIGNGVPEIHFIKSDPTKLFIIYSDGTICLYDSKNDCLLQYTSVAIKHHGVISSVLTQDESILVLGTYLGHSLFVYASHNLRHVSTLHDPLIPQNSSVEAIVVMGNSQYVVSGTLVHDEGQMGIHQAGQIAIWDLRYTRLHRLLNFEDGVTAIVPLLGSLTVVAGFIDGAVRFVNSVDGSILKELRPHLDTILYLHFDHTHYLMTAGDDGRFMVLEMSDFSSFQFNVLTESGQLEDAYMQ